jgi:hypothetical protein
MKAFLTSALRRSIEKKAVQNLSKLSDSSDNRTVSPSKNYSVCPWLESHQQLNKVYAKRLLSPDISHIKIRPLSMRMNPPIVSNRLYKPWTIRRTQNEDALNSIIRCKRKSDANKSIKMVSFHIHTKSFDNTANCERPILPPLKESRGIESRNKHVVCLSHLVGAKTAFKAASAGISFNKKMNCSRQYATNLKAELKEIANFDSKLALRNNPCIIMMEEKKRRCKNTSEFSKYYSKLMKENILHTHKAMPL